jgi:hypothetical protein
MSRTEAERLARKNRQKVLVERYLAYRAARRNNRAAVANLNDSLAQKGAAYQAFRSMRNTMRAEAIWDDIVPAVDAVDKAWSGVMLCVEEGTRSDAEKALHAWDQAAERQQEAFERLQQFLYS